MKQKEYMEYKINEIKMSYLVDELKSLKRCPKWYVLYLMGEYGLDLELYPYVMRKLNRRSIKIVKAVEKAFSLLGSPFYRLGYV